MTLWNPGACLMERVLIPGSHTQTSEGRGQGAQCLDRCAPGCATALRGCVKRGRNPEMTLQEGRASKIFFGPQFLRKSINNVAFESL